MNQCVFRADRVRKYAEKAEGLVRGAGAKAKQPGVEYMHQAFQRLIDWSIGETGYDVSAVISGPNGFYTNHLIKDSGDFAWIDSHRT